VYYRSKTRGDKATRSRTNWGTYSYYNFVATGVPNKYSWLPNTAGNVLLGGISIQAVPEPGTWAMMLLGFAGIGFASRRRQLRAVHA
jgi:hypothetical protein